MKLIYFGTAHFALPTLRAMAEHVALVVTQPDRPSGRGMRMQPTPVMQLAQELELPAISPERCRAPEVVEQLRSLEADALLVAAYGQILSVDVLESAMRGGINLHGSILPMYRGAAPIQRAVFNQESETGVSLMQMDRGMDTGDVIDICRTPIGSDETYGELQDRLAVMAADLATAWMPRIVAGDYPRKPQNSDMATLAPKIEKSEGVLSVAHPVRKEYAKFRAFSPAPGATLMTVHGPLKLIRVRATDESMPIGTVVREGGEWRLGFATGSLVLLDVQPAGKRPMPFGDVANGWRLNSGDLLANAIP